MLFLPGHHFSSANIGSHAGSCIGFCLKISSTFFGTYFVVQTPLIEISSTFIRKGIREGKDLRYFLHPEVFRIIQEKGLYR